jgi:hypothetical protein
MSGSDFSQNVMENPLRWRDMIWGQSINLHEVM